MWPRHAGYLVFCDAMTTMARCCGGGGVIQHRQALFLREGWQVGDVKDENPAVFDRCRDDGARGRRSPPWRRRLGVSASSLLAWVAVSR